MRSDLIFGDTTLNKGLTSIIIDIKLGELGKHVIRTALNRFSTYNFNSLKEIYPQLESVKEFIESDNYLTKLSVKVIGNQSSLVRYSQEDKLYIAKSVLKDLEPILRTRSKSYRGTKEFKPSMFNKVFRDKIVLNVSVPSSGTQEFGESMKTPKNSAYALDLSNVKWYAYNDNYGTSEEKALVKYIEGKMDKFTEKYDEIYLVRNEKDLKIYDFAEGRPFEPDFVLFLRIKGASDKYDNLQLFIEPKGDNLLVKDKWKNDFLKQIKSIDKVTWYTKTDDYMVWGIPFFNESSNNEFMTALDEDVLEYEPNSTEKVSINENKIIPLSEVLEGRCYVEYLPVYSIKAACGYFGNGEIVEPVGWMRVEGFGRLNSDMFVVQAKGNSMETKIHDGDYCVFAKYQGGTRNGEIVLCEHRNYYDETNTGAYSIKQYISEKRTDEDGLLCGTKVTLLPFNSDYNPIVIDADIDDTNEFKVVAIYKGKV